MVSPVLGYDGLSLSAIDKRTMDTDWNTLQRLLHRGGAKSYYWIMPSKKSTWFDADAPADVPTVKKNIYFGVHPSTCIPERNSRGEIAAPEDVRSQIPYIASINCLFAEYDAKDWGNKDAIQKHIYSLPIYPSVIVDSGGGFHCYWIFDTPWILQSDAQRTDAATLQYQWVTHVKGDKASKDLARVLRVPDTLNYKYKPALEVRVVSASYDDLYALETLRAEIKQNYKGDSKKRDVAPPASGNSSESDYWLDAARGRSEGRNQRGVWLANQLRDNGFSETDAKDVMLKFADLVTGEKPEPYPYREALSTLNWAYARTRRDPAYERRGDKYLNGGDQEYKNGHYVAIAFTDPPTTPPPPNPPDPDDDEPNLLAFEATDEGNAEAVWSLHATRFAYVKEWGWLHFNGTHWTTEGAEATLGFAVTNTLRQRRIQAVARENDAIIKCAKPDQRVIRPCIAALMKHAHTLTYDFDRVPHYLNVRNGVIDLQTGELINRQNADDRFTYCIPVVYDPNADASLWEEFLYDVVRGGADVIRYLQESVGYSLTGDTREECLFYLWGETRSGKGTFTETLMSLLGKPLSVEVDFNTFTTQAHNPDAQNFALAPLHPSRVVFASESGKYSVLNEAKIKALTGGNDIHCAFKGKSHFTYKPKFKIWLSSNNLPNMDVNDNAVWGRLRQIDFPKSYLGREDKTLKRRMREPKVLSGILRWAVEGAVRWYSTTDGLRTPSEVKETTQKSRSELDTVQQWIDENMSAVPDTWTANTAIQNNYQNWCNENGHKPLGGKWLGRSLAQKGYPTGVRKVSGSSQRGIIGLVIAGSRSSIPSYFPPPPPDPPEVLPEF